MTESLEKILADRNKTHGNWDDQAACAQALKKIASEHTNHLEKPAFMQEALDMIRHKESRIEIGDMWEPEHWVDISGYATCVVRILKRAQGYVDAKLKLEERDWDTDHGTDPPRY
jgi:hypothetical protein